MGAVGQLALEIGQPLVTHAAAKTHHGRFADLGLRGQCTHGQARKSQRIGQHHTGHTLLGGRQGRKTGSDAFKHGKQKTTKMEQGAGQRHALQPKIPRGAKTVARNGAAAGLNATRRALHLPYTCAFARRVRTRTDLQGCAV